MKFMILVLYLMTVQDPRIDHWSDGFVQALNAINQNNNFEVIRVNIVDSPSVDLNAYDFVLVKGGFNGNVHKYAKEFFKEHPKKTGLGICISTIGKPLPEDLEFYDILFYETEWYRKYANLDRHKNIYHAFGIDRTVMKPMNLKKIYDYLFIGNTKAYKCPLKFLEKKGKNLAIALWLDKKIKKKFLDNKITTIDFVAQEKLAEYYNFCKTLYVPAKIDGGGERAILEARSCGINVQIEDYNPKLKELLTSPIYDSSYYAKQIIHGLLNYFKKV